MPFGLKSRGFHITIFKISEACPSIFFALAMILIIHLFFTRSYNIYMLVNSPYKVAELVSGRAIT